MPRRPVIGLTSRVCAFSQDGKSYDRFGVAIAYCEAVEAAGGTPIILPLSEEPSVLNSYWRLIDGLLLPGGQDVSPQHYGEDPRPELEAVDPRRDRVELVLARRALDENMPVLAICRGEQLLNVAAGGTLHQDIHVALGKQCLRHFQKTVDESPWHRVQVAEQSLLHTVMGESALAVNSYHHQAVKDVAPGFRAVATSADGVIESIESPAHAFMLGVQWHPELLWREHAAHHALFRAHVEMARRRIAQPSSG
ncbi:MAG: gamma-glutamyl-gamma-aminobutyrate hydrolase family protein [Planctomycetes bacterium]|nr:gamma-glutamyl-gamma-aminobutyrate hydrolase family protein [Planctomycetota bacterium]